MNKLIESLRPLLEKWGLGPTTATIVMHFVVVFVVLLLAGLANFFAKRLLLRAVKTITTKSRTKWDDIVFQQGVFRRLSHIAPAIVIYGFSHLLFPEIPAIGVFVRRISFAYMIFVSAISVDALLNAGVEIYRTFAMSKDRPIKAYVQVVKILLFIAVSILIIATLLEKSPWGLLSGLGALTAILMLVFKDSILGLVASIQLMANNMVRRGDWIEMSKFGADGDVIDVSLTTVKVQNWDKTITTIPTYALISDSFKNWRGMSESGGRRIKRSISIDMNSVQFCSEELTQKLKRVQLLEDYISQKENEISTHNQELSINSDSPINGRRMTNLGMFRAYLQAYLKNHPQIHKAMTFLVRQLPPSESGIPIEIYVFSSDQVWANYESIQADIFDHILAALPEFELRVFQSPSGADFSQALRRNTA